MRTAVVLFAALLAAPWHFHFLAARQALPAAESDAAWANRLRCPDRPSGTLNAFSGRWQTADRKMAVTFVCADDHGERSWLVVIPDGAREGAIGAIVARTPTGAGHSATGVWRSRETPADPQPVTLSIDEARSLEICWSGQPCVALGWLGPVNDERLGQIAVIGHRAASLGHEDLENTLAAVATAASFGCTGIEIDVVIPYIEADGRKVPAPGEARVTHPPEIRAEITGFDSIALDKASSFPRLTDMLRAVADTPLRLVYLDLKLKWLGTDAGTITSVLDDLGQQIDQSDLPASVHVFAGAEVSKPGAVADVLSAQDHQSWILEFTRGTSAQRFWDLATLPSGAPAALSFNLLGISGGGGGLLGWFLRDVSTDWERRYRDLPQPKIFWTANSDEQMKGAFRAVSRMSPGPAGVLTSSPHRFIWLAANQ